MCFRFGRLLWLALVLALGLALAACQRQPKSELQRGAAVFSRACASCHALAGGQKPLGFDVQPPNLADPHLQARLNDSEIRRIVREGKGQMPPFGKMLSEPEVSALLAYLRSLPRSAPAER